MEKPGLSNPKGIHTFNNTPPPLSKAKQSNVEYNIKGYLNIPI